MSGSRKVTTSPGRASSGAMVRTTVTSPVPSVGSMLPESTTSGTCVERERHREREPDPDGEARRRHGGEAQQCAKHAQRGHHRLDQPQPEPAAARRRKGGHRRDAFVSSASSSRSTATRRPIVSSAPAGIHARTRTTRSSALFESQRLRPLAQTRERAGRERPATRTQLHVNGAVEVMVAHARPQAHVHRTAGDVRHRKRRPGGPAARLESADLQEGAGTRHVHLTGCHRRQSGRPPPATGWRRAPGKQAPSAPQAPGRLRCRRCGLVQLLNSCQHGKRSRAPRVTGCEPPSAACACRC